MFTDSPLVMLQAEAEHRRHAIIEQVIADLKNDPLAHLPSGRFNANGAWLVLAAMAFNLTRAAGALASLFHPRATTATADHHPGAGRALARRVRLRLPAHWPWAEHWLDLLTAATGPEVGVDELRAQRVWTADVAGTYSPAGGTGQAADGEHHRQRTTSEPPGPPPQTEDHVEEPGRPADTTHPRAEPSTTKINSRERNFTSVHPGFGHRDAAVRVGNDHGRAGDLAYRLPDRGDVVRQPTEGGPVGTRARKRNGDRLGVAELGLQELSAARTVPGTMDQNIGGTVYVVLPIWLVFGVGCSGVLKPSGTGEVVC